MVFQLRVIFFLFISFCLGDNVWSQVSGQVYQIKSKGDKELLPGVNVYWQGTVLGTVTDDKGEFSIEKPDSLHMLVFSMVGFQSETLHVMSDQKILQVQLKESVELEEVEVIAEKGDTEYSMIKPINSESINIGELKKAACCNLAESFESNASVDVVYSDAVSGARTIQMLGLGGIYTQMLTENTPLTRGLSANYGMSFIPGTWIESIQITKGAGSVVNGYESMTGQINLEFLKPEDKKAEKLYLNLYGNMMGRAEANLHLGRKFNDKVSSLLFIHGNQFFTKNDQNSDGFLDNPLGKQLNVFNRWKIQGKKTEQVIGLRAVIDEKAGGQMNFDNSKLQSEQSPYGIGINTRLIEGFVKNGFLFPNSATTSMGVILSGKHHVQNSFFGLRNYDAEENSMNLNVIYQNAIRTTDHSYKLGVSYLYDNYSELWLDSLFGRTESVPGIFGEYTYTLAEKFSFLAGVRGDQHNLFGFRVTPRAHVKYVLKARTTFRASVGTGFRTANVFMENSAPLASSRTVRIPTTLLPEESFNAGGSINHRMEWFSREAVVNLDYYYTQFMNQVVIDFDRNPSEIWFTNLSGESFSHSLQADISFEPIKRFTVKAAYKHYLVRTSYQAGLLDRPFVPRDRAMLNFSFETENKKWKIDLINNWFGSSRIPSTSSNPIKYQMPEKSREYVIVHAQVTKLFRHFEWYLGVENALNFVQGNAIISPDDPFGAYFDASMIWGPMNGRNIYSGIRFAIK